MWSSWSELNKEYSLSIRMAKKVKYCLKNIETSQAIADKELLNNMISEGSEIIQKLKQKTLFEFGSLSEKELSILTDRQKEIATLRQFHTYSDISKITGLPQTTVYDLFQKALKKVRQEKRNQYKSNDIELPARLSKQQEQIYILHRKGKKPIEIAEIIGTSPGNVRKQLVTIKQKRYQNPENFGMVTI